MKADDQQSDSRSLTSIDSGLGGNQADNFPPSTRDQDDSSAKSRTQNGQSSQKHKDSASMKDRSKAKPCAHSGSDTYGCTEEEVLKELARFKAVPLEKLDNHTGILHVWLLVLEGLASTVSTCPKNYQPQTLEVLFELLRSAAQTPGISSALILRKVIHSVN